ncbi:hypothetical protein ACJZ2D_008885 [Fusarium nematophilum]
MDQPSLQPDTKRRGRPRKKRSADEVLNTRRERNRKAQKLHRIRHLAAEEEQKQKLKSLETSLSEVVSVFLTFTNHVVQSDLAQRDLSLMNQLRQCTERILAYVDESPQPSTTASVCTDTYDASVQLPLSQFRDTSRAVIDGPETGNPSPTMDATLPYESHPEPNIDSLSGVGSHQVARSHALNKPLLDNPLSLQITYLAIQNAYRLLSTAAQPPGTVVSRVFGFALEHHSPQEILNNLYWYLGPGYAQLGSLAVASFLHPTYSPSTQEAHDGSSSTVGRLLNADEIARLLRQRTRGDASHDTLEIMIKGAPLSIVETAISPLLQNVLDRSVASPNDSYIPDDHALAAATVRVSKSRLLYHVSRSGFCLVSGPAFSERGLDQAILESIISPAV